VAARISVASGPGASAPPTWTYSSRCEATKSSAAPAAAPPVAVEASASAPKTVVLRSGLVASVGDGSQPRVESWPEIHAAP
jgi:hypothetical protein